MTRVSRQDWIEEGFHILVDEGDGALTVDALCARLDRSKGSFYHHFDGRPGYVEALLDTWERQATDRLIETGHSDAPVEDRLRAVNRQASELRNARLERAIRGWASREPLARGSRTGSIGADSRFLEELCAERMGNSDAGQGHGAGLPAHLRGRSTPGPAPGRARSCTGRSGSWIPCSISEFDFRGGWDDDDDDDETRTAAAMIAAGLMMATAGAASAQEQIGCFRGKPLPDVQDVLDRGDAGRSSPWPRRRGR